MRRSLLFRGYALRVRFLRCGCFILNGTPVRTRHIMGVFELDSPGASRRGTLRGPEAAKLPTCYLFGQHLVLVASNTLWYGKSALIPGSISSSSLSATFPPSENRRMPGLVRCQERRTRLGFHGLRVSPQLGSDGIGLHPARGHGC